MNSLSRSAGSRMVLTLAITVGLLISASGSALASRPAHQPDLFIGNMTTGQCCLGADTVESWPDKQQLDASVSSGQYIKLEVLLQNLGTVTDSFRIFGEGSYGGVHLRYFSGLKGTHDITEEIEGTGYRVSNLPPEPGPYVALRIRVWAREAPVGFERSVRIIARAVGKPHAMDAVSFPLTVVN